MTEQTKAQPKIPVKLELDLRDVNIILIALQEIPGKLCNPLSVKIKEQVQDQLPKEG